MKRMAIALLVATATATVAPLSVLSVPSAYAAASDTAVVVSGVNMRSGASTSASVIRMLKKGEKVTIVKEVNAYWYQVKDAQGKTGYVSTSSQYLKVSSAPTSTPAPSSKPSVSPSQTNGEIVAGVNFRSEPSTSGSVIRMLKKGEKVEVLSKVSDYWYKIKDSSGKTGYISTSSSYIKVTGSIPSTGNGGGSTTKPTPTPTPKPTPTPGQESGSKVDKVIAAGMKYLGTPYEYGSNRNTTSTFDCSDLIRQMFIDALGIKLPADSRGQGSYVKNKGNTTTNWKNLKRGDLLFFTDYKGTKASDYSGINKATARISHVAIYLGDGKVLHTYSKDSGGVRTDSIVGKHWEYRFLFGGSAL